MSKEKQEKQATKATSYIDEKYIIETIYHNNSPRFMVLNGNGPEIKGFAKPTSELWLKPFPDPFDNLKKKSVLLATNIEDYGSRENLLQDIKTFISSYAYLPEFWLNVATHYALLTWVYDRFSSIGYLEFLGHLNSGKTRIAKCIGECCYNTVKLNGVASVPALYRLIERFKGTLLIDEADYTNTDFDSEIAKIINMGYTADGYVWRCDTFEKDYEPRAYCVFGPKILSHREKYKDEATNSRCISYLIPNNQKIPDHITSQIPFVEFNSRGEKIRNKCLKWRLDNYRQLEPDLVIAKQMGLSGRFEEIIIPLLNVIEDKSFFKEFVEFMKESSSDSKGSSELSLYAQVLRRMMKSSPKHIWISDVTDEINALYKDLGEDKTVKGRAVGHNVKLLGVETRRVTQGYRIEMTAENKKKLEAVFHDYPELG